MTSELPTLPPRVELIIRQASAYHNVSYKDVVGQTRTKGPSHVRFEAMYRIRDEILIGGQPPSLPQIGRWFSGRDHTTVLHGLRRFEELNPSKIPPSRQVEKISTFTTRMAAPAPYRLQMMADLAEAAA